MAELPGGETGPFAPGNEITFYYQNVLTDPPEQAMIVECDNSNQLVRRSCIRLSNNATFPLTPTETGGVMYGNDTLQFVLMQDEGGLPSGVGQFNNIETGETRGMRWVSLPARGGVPAMDPDSDGTAEVAVATQ
ncbi:MAG: hypothetical protein AAGL89_06585 [Pseudomonadota bacterium]